MIKAVLWDFGGVITTSPFDAFNRFERAHGLPENFIRRLNATSPDTNAWARLERNEISIEEFDLAFEQEAHAAGHGLKGSTVLGLLKGEVRPVMVEALRRCGRRFRTACLTNNIRAGKGARSQDRNERTTEIQAVMKMFDVVIESSKVGVRKPDPRFYEMACQQLEIAPDEAVFLDDLGVNLKPARAMGMTTIKVEEPVPALITLGEVLGLSLT